MHSRTPGSADQVVKVAYFDTLLSLIKTSYDKITDWKVNTLGQGGCANYEFDEALSHGVFYCQSDSMRCIAMMRENAKQSPLCGCIICTEICYIKAMKSFKLFFVRNI